jgi:hypothetical protein
MMRTHWHKWLSGDEWAKMGPFPDEQACPYCRVERAEARVKELEEIAEDFALVATIVQEMAAANPELPGVWAGRISQRLSRIWRALRGEEER